MTRPSMIAAIDRDRAVALLERISTAVLAEPADEKTWHQQNKPLDGPERLAATDAVAMAVEGKLGEAVRVLVTGATLSAHQARWLIGRATDAKLSTTAGFHFRGIDEQGEAELVLDVDGLEASAFVSRELWQVIGEAFDVRGEGGTAECLAYEKVTTTHWRFDCDHEPWQMVVGNGWLFIEHQQHNGDEDPWMIEMHLQNGAWSYDENDAERLAGMTRDSTPAALLAFILEHGVPGLTEPNPAHDPSDGT